MEISSAVRPWIGSPMAPRRLREDLDGVMQRHMPGPEMHLGGALVVAGNETVEDLGEEAAFLGAEAPHDAEIDGDHAWPALVHEQVALVHVGVEEAVAHGVGQERAQHDEAELLQVVSLGLEAFAARRSECRRPIPWSAHAWRYVSSRRRGCGSHVLADVLRHLRTWPRPRGAGPSRARWCGRGSRPRRAARRREGVDALYELGGEAVAVEVALEALLDARAQDLDRDLTRRSPLLQHDAPCGPGRCEAAATGGPKEMKWSSSLPPKAALLRRGGLPPC